MERRGMICAAATLMVAGCAGGVSEDLRTARATVQQAQQGEAARLEPEELRTAETLLQRAEAAPNGSALEQDLAYLADRQARIAIANSSEVSTWQQLEKEQREYVRQLETAVTGQRQALGEQRARTEEAQRHAAAALSELGAVRQEQGATILTLPGEVLFDFDQARLRPGARQRLRAVASVLKARPDAVIVVEGHTDARGTETYNHQLSQRRADVVRRFLIEEGVDPHRIRAVGRGEEQPVASNATPEGRADNRRVEIVVRQPARARAGRERQPPTS